MIFIIWLQDESNGGMPVSENHISDIETSKSKKSSDVSRFSAQKHEIYDFTDEQVNFWVSQHFRSPFCIILSLSLSFYEDFTK